MILWGYLKSVELLSAPGSESYLRSDRQPQPFESYGLASLLLLNANH